MALIIDVKKINEFIIRMSFGTYTNVFVSCDNKSIKIKEEKRMVDYIDIRIHVNLTDDILNLIDFIKDGDEFEWDSTIETNGNSITPKDRTSYFVYIDDNYIGDKCIQLIPHKIGCSINLLYNEEKDILIKALDTVTNLL